MYAAKFLASSVAKRVTMMMQRRRQQQQQSDDSPSNKEVDESDDDDDDADGETTTTTPPPPSSSSSAVRPPRRASFGFSGIDVDVIERLPVPYGLVRYGVAPDHPEVKNVERDFASLFDAHSPPPDDGGGGDDADDDADDAAGVATLSYFGNVDVGRDVSLADLRCAYDVVILAYGTQSSDNRLGIPGSGDGELDGVLSAREFVAWYNGHPEFGFVGDVVGRCLRRGGRSSTGTGVGGDGDENDDDDDGDDISSARVVVVGQGNVALDVARVLVKGARGLADTDAPSSVLDILGGGVSHVSVVGRRGHVQGAFTIKVGVRRRHAPHSSYMFIRARRLIGAF
jgi:adrenodoxin-NADP+ reductase